MPCISVADGPPANGGTIARHERTSPLPAPARRRATASVGFLLVTLLSRALMSGAVMLDPDGPDAGVVLCSGRGPDRQRGRAGGVSMPARRSHRPTTRSRSPMRSSMTATPTMRPRPAAATACAHSAPRCSPRWRRSCCWCCCFPPPHHGASGFTSTAFYRAIDPRRSPTLRALRCPADGFARGSCTSTCARLPFVSHDLIQPFTRLPASRGRRIMRPSAHGAAPPAPSMRAGARALTSAGPCRRGRSTNTRS